MWKLPNHFRHAHCFNWKRVFKSLTVYNDAALFLVVFGSQKNKLKITNIGDMYGANLTLRSFTILSFGFTFKYLGVGSLGKEKNSTSICMWIISGKDIKIA